VSYGIGSSCDHKVAALRIPWSRDVYLGVGKPGRCRFLGRMLPVLVSGRSRGRLSCSQPTGLDRVVGSSGVGLGVSLGVRFDWPVGLIGRCLLGGQRGLESPFTESGGQGCPGSVQCLNTRRCSNGQYWHGTPRIAFLLFHILIKISSRFLSAKDLHKHRDS
jgi:hypothetical protein